MQPLSSLFSPSKRCVSVRYSLRVVLHRSVRFECPNHVCEAPHLPVHSLYSIFDMSPLSQAFLSSGHLTKSIGADLMSNKKNGASPGPGAKWRRGVMFWTRAILCYLLTQVACISGSHVNLSWACPYGLSHIGPVCDPRGQSHKVQPIWIPYKL